MSNHGNLGAMPRFLPPAAYNSGALGGKQGESKEIAKKEVELDVEAGEIGDIESPSLHRLSESTCVEPNVEVGEVGCIEPPSLQHRTSGTCVEPGDDGM